MIPSTGAKSDTMLFRRVPYLTTQIKPIVPIIPKVLNTFFSEYTEES